MAIDTTRPRLSITAPTLSPLPFGLLSVANELTPSDVHAQLGVQYETLSGVVGSLAGLDAHGALSGTLSPNETFSGTTPAGVFPTIYTNPFLTYAGVQAHIVGHTIEEIQDRATAKLALNAGRLIEKALWSGTASSNDQLNAATTTVLNPTPGTAVPIQYGLGLLENWLGNIVGAQGLLHAPRTASGSLWNLVHVAGNRQLSVLGTAVSFGAGYDGTGPTGATNAAPAAGTTWLYASGPVTVVRSQVGYSTVPPAQKTDLSHNLATVYATEIVSVAFESGAAAVLVTL